MDFTGSGCLAPTDAGTCPTGCSICICASPDTPIATPGGDVPIASLRPGDQVYSVDRGEVTVVPIDAVQRIAAPRGHVVQRVVLSTGSVLEISAPHPTADGRTFGELRAGNLLDGVEIREVTAVAYRYDQTYDILPASDSAAYFANGVLIKSTMASGSIPVREPTAPLSR